MAREYTAFALDEYRERIGRARSALRRAGLDAVVAVSPEALYYLSGYDSWTSAVNPQGLVFTAEEVEPTLLIRDYDLALARESAIVDDIQTFSLASDSPAHRLADILHKKGLRRGRVGIDLQSPAVTGHFALALADALGDSALVDATELLGDLRLVKSPREIAYLRQAAEHAAAGLAETRVALRAGRTEIQVAADVEAAVRRAGSDYWAIPMEFTTGPRTAAGHGAPRLRIIQGGDLAHFEFAGVAARYHATAMATMAVGDPGKRCRDIHRVCAESIRAGAGAIRSGASAADVETASLVPLQREGLDRYATARFGYGIGIAYPPIWLETLQISRASNQILEPGMVFVLHTTLTLPDENIGVMQGGTYMLGQSGLEMLVGDGDAPLVMT